MTQLVDDDVVDTLGRSFNQFRIQNDVGCSCTTAPPLLHLLNSHSWQQDAKSLHVLVALLNASMKQLLRVLPIPILDQCSHATGTAGSTRVNMQITPNEFDGVIVSRMDL